MPTAWEPWPGNRKAIMSLGSSHRSLAPRRRSARPPPAFSPLASRRAVARLALPPHEQGAPGKAAAEGREQHEVPRPEAARRGGLLERDVDGRGARVAVAVDVDEDALHRPVGALGPPPADPGGGLGRG